MKRGLIFALLLLMLVNFANAATPPGSWTLMPQYSDEFNGASLDASKWHNPLTWYSKSNNNAVFRSQNVDVSNGMANFWAKNEYYDGVDFTIGSIQSKFEIQYGYIEYRAKTVAKDANVVAALWFSDINYGPEIDLLETLSPRSNPKNMYMTLHLWPPAVSSHVILASNTHVASTSLADDFHVYGLEWDEDQLKFYYDGQIVWTYDGTDFRTPQWILVSLETHAGLPNPSYLPAAAQVDYIRVYQKGGAATCSDGTSLNQCSTSSGAPWYCDGSGNLMENCQTCGCSNDWTCSASGTYCIGNFDLCDNLQALYHFDGNANDDSTNSNNGAVNGPAIISSQPGFSQAYNFDGVDDYIQINDPGAGSVFDLQGDFTVSAWVKFDTFTNDESSTKMFPRIIQKGTDISDAQAWSLDVDTYTPTGVFCDQSNVVHFMASVGGTKHSFCGTTTLQTGTWYHLAVVRSGSSLNMYLDGNPNSAGSFGSTANIDSYDEALYIGEDLDNPDGAVDGVIDDVAIWNRALSDSEISNLYSSGAPVDCGSSSGSSCNSGADTGGNSVVEITELINFIGQWKTGTKTITELINAIGEWKAGC